LIDQRATLSDFSPEEARSIKTALTKPNPKYYELERLGKFTGKTPREVKFFEKTEDGGLIVPRSYGARQAGSLANITDRTIAPPTEEPLVFHGEDRPYQAAAAAAITKRWGGTVQAPTGAGKTALACLVASILGVKFLVLVHTNNLMKQWIEDIETFLQISAGRIGGGKWAPGQDATVAIVNSARKRPDELPPYGLIFCDECHRAPTDPYLDVLLGGPAARYRYALSATIFRRDKMEKLLDLHFGPRLFEMSRKEAEDQGAIVPAVVHRYDLNPPWEKLIPELLASEWRNQEILDLALELSVDTFVVILTDRTGHVDELGRRLREKQPSTAVLHGQQKAKEHQANWDSVFAGAKITVATTSLIGEGLNVKPWQAVILAAPSSSQSPRSLQSIGRAVRPAPGKTHADIYYMVDLHERTKRAWYGLKSLFKRDGISVVEGDTDE
jgi:superfamily II DNA or RNA helicase